MDLTGVNSAAVGSAYTSSIPAQTSTILFKAGGLECFDSQYYWASTEFASGYSWMQNFNNGVQTCDITTTSYGVRAVRKELIT